jgi:ankyrin repeat protein
VKKAGLSLALGALLAAAIFPAHAAPSPTIGPGNPLIDAVQNDDRSSVAELLGQHPEVNARLEDGGTALAWAAVRSNAEIAELLLKAGANPNLVNEQGIGPLYLAIANGSPAIVRLLVAHGADVNLARPDGETPLMLATRLGQIDAIKMMPGTKSSARRL